MDLETQDALTRAVSEEVSDETREDSLGLPVVETRQEAPVTTFSRLRQTRRAFGSTEKSNETSPMDKDGVDDAPLAGCSTTEQELMYDEEYEDNGSGIFGTTQSETGSVNSSPFKMASFETEDTEIDAPSVDPLAIGDTGLDDEAQFETQKPAVVDDKSYPSPNNQNKDYTSDSSKNEGDDSEDDMEPKESSKMGSTNCAVARNCEIDAEMEEETRSDALQDFTETSRDSSTEEVTAEEEISGVLEKKIPDRQSLITSTDQLFLQVTDRQKVTVKDILQSLQTEYECEKFSKEHKATVRERLTALILGQVQPLQDSEPESSSEDDEESESEASGADAEDSEFEAPRSRKKVVRKKTLKKKNEATERRNRVKRKSAAAIKAAAVRVQAEQLRKKRLEELRVRNEELQLLHNREEQKRAAQIAAKLETDTEEIRLERLEQRLDLLEKLDKKRFAVIQEVPPAKVEEVKETVKTQSSEEEESEEESSEEEMELEFVGKPTKPFVCFQQDAPISLLSWADKGIRVPTKKDPIKTEVNDAFGDSTTDDFMSLLNQTRKNRASPGQSLNARALLKKRLLSKQRRMGNQWLARELGYQNEKEHVDDCLKAENKKRLLTLRLEQERIQANERKILRERWLKAEHEVDLDDDDTEDEEYVDPDEIQNDAVQADEEDDDEMAVARELNQIDESGPTKEPSSAADDTQTFEKEELPLIGEQNSGDAEAMATEISTDGNPKLLATANECAVSESNEIENSVARVFPEGEKHDMSNTENPPTEQEQAIPSSDSNDNSQSSVLQLETQPLLVPANKEEEPGEGDSEADRDSETEPEKPQGPRNSAWREMLKREAEKVKKLKKRKGEMIDDEADEEEEEEIVGLEDFGFAMHKKKKPGDDDNDADEEFNEDDLENVVDDVSDGEGDEDAGEEARKAMELREEKERHKEIMRRMREGYDGRRGGIAGGGAGARGVHRFDQLVAADNREDAKRLGLLNDDEMDSEDEKEGNKGDDDEEEDETALLDKMLKDRFLHRSSVDLEENFSEDEGEDDDKGSTLHCQNDEDLEEKEQERMAKRFTKRARMQRLIEAHGHEEEFSQLRLIEEDTTLKEELQKMKNGLVRKRSQSHSLMPSESSQSGSLSSKRQKTGMSAFAPSTNGSSLAIALQASRRTQKRTSFLRNSSTASSETTASFQRSVGFKHVIFQSSNSRASSFGASKSQSSALPGVRTNGFSTSSSLWANVSRGFQKRH